MRVFFTLIITVLLVAPATSQTMPIPTTRLKPTTIAAFKNGLAFFIC